MDYKSLFESFEQIRKDMTASDPLLKKGITEDYVCCMSSHTYHDLKQQIEAQHPFTMTGFLGDRVRALVRRDVWIFDNMPHLRIEYMPRERALARDLGNMLRIKQAFATDNDKSVGEDTGTDDEAGRGNWENERGSPF